jgi:carboxypeptidase C (cathepsin A)
MYLNPYSFNKKANIIYLESPGGVGFSYASQKSLITNDTQTAKDNLNALRYFFEKFPLYKPNSFYIAG